MAQTTGMSFLAVAPALWNPEKIQRMVIPFSLSDYLREVNLFSVAGSVLGNYILGGLLVFILLSFNVLYSTIL